MSPRNPQGGGAEVEPAGLESSGPVAGYEVTGSAADDEMANSPAGPESNEPAAGSEPLHSCAHLRTKGMYLPLNPHADRETPGGSSTAVYWCLRTMKMTGPDAGLVTPAACAPDRVCYKAPA